ncbi:hypothetical protein BVG19_g1114 [[Candida] boidinii]|nr:hypothetical protein BVG19_g1114 [[Candida] boidinii]OWB50132.1 hypothetical protein B5S27_g1679 [[Candida] boidinii]
MLRITTEGLSYGHITFLTFQAVIQVVIICLSGFWTAKTGLLNNDATKVISRLNVDLFTPALIFAKLASSLSLQKLVEIIIIPLFYALTTGVSFVSSHFISKWLNLTEPESDFVTAMAVFGNSNSLPVSLTLALSYTLPGLEWDQIDDDSNDKIASRGILYLLIFQQLGQVLRWSWGYNKLLKKRTHEEIFHSNNIQDIEHSPITPANREEESVSTNSNKNSLEPPKLQISDSSNSLLLNVPHHYGSTNHDEIEEIQEVNNHNSNNTRLEGSQFAGHWSEGSSFNNSSTNSSSSSLNKNLSESTETVIDETNGELVNINLDSVPFSQLSLLDKSIRVINIFITKFISWMNPPLWAMLISVIVASVPSIRYEFFEANGFLQNTVGLSIKQLGSVSIPLILVVLGANLAPSSDIPPACPNYSKMIFGSLLSRIILPSIVLLPIITICVKYVNTSILDDPIFLIVAFILTASPPAIQLSQICQLNEIYQKEMAGVLFWGYVVLTLPVTIIIVVAALVCLDWAK